MGSEVITPAKPRLQVEVHGTAPIALVDVIRGDRRVHRVSGNGKLDVEIDWEDSDPLVGETWYYIRVRQEDFSIAWSSPIWVHFTGDPAQSTSENETDLPKWNSPPYWPFESPEPADPVHTTRLEAIFEIRNIPDRFIEINQIGVFSEARGRFALFHALDREVNRTPVHIHLYIDFEDDRLFIAEGHADYGVSLK